MRRFFKILTIIMVCILGITVQILIYQFGYMRGMSATNNNNEPQTKEILQADSQLYEEVTTEPVEEIGATATPFQSTSSSQQVTDEPICVTKIVVNPVEDYGNWRYFYIYTRNDTSENINTVSISISLLDEKMNIIDTTGAYVDNRVAPGQEIAVEALTDNTEAKYINVDGYSYYVGSPMDNDSKFTYGYFTTTYEPVPMKEGTYSYSMSDDGVATIK